MLFYRLLALFCLYIIGTAKLVQLCMLDDLPILHGVQFYTVKGLLLASAYRQQWCKARDLCLSREYCLSRDLVLT